MYKQFGNKGSTSVNTMQRKINCDNGTANMDIGAGNIGNFTANDACASGRQLIC